VMLCRRGVHQLYQQAVKNLRALGLPQAVLVEYIGCRQGCAAYIGGVAWGTLCFVSIVAPGVETPRHRLQQLSAIMKIAPPEYGCALAGQAIGRIGIQCIVANKNASRRRAILRCQPARLAFLLIFCPASQSKVWTHSAHA